MCSPRVLLFFASSAHFSLIYNNVECLLTSFQSSSSQFFSEIIIRTAIVLRLLSRLFAYLSSFHLGLSLVAASSSNLTSSSPTHLPPTTTLRASINHLDIRRIVAITVAVIFLSSLLSHPARYHLRCIASLLRPSSARALSLPLPRAPSSGPASTTTASSRLLQTCPGMALSSLLSRVCFFLLSAVFSPSPPILLLLFCNSLSYTRIHCSPFLSSYQSFLPKPSTASLLTLSNPCFYFSSGYFFFWVF